LLAAIFNAQLNTATSGSTFEDILTKIDAFEINNKFDARCDNNLAMAISKGKVIYHNEDLHVLKGKRKSLISYIEKHAKKVLANFNTFFDSKLVDCNVIDSVVLDTNGANVKDIKIKLFEKFQDEVDIEHREKDYFKFITTNKGLKINASALCQFANVELTPEEKVNLLIRGVGTYDKELLVKFILSIGGEFKFDKKNTARPKKGPINNKAVAWLQDFSWFKISDNRKGEHLITLQKSS